MSAVFSPIGSMVILPCQAVGMPRPQTHWVDEEGRDIVNHHYNPRYMVLPNGDLLIENLEWSDMGGPTCTAESTSGIARAETFLYPVVSILTIKLYLYLRCSHLRFTRSNGACDFPVEFPAVMQMFLRMIENFCQNCLSL